MRISFGVTSASLAIAACLAWPGTASAIGDLTINVNCAGGRTIGQALSRPTVVDRRLVIVINGTCSENVTIARDDVVLRSSGGGGVAATDPSVAAIYIDGAKRVSLENLVVTGGHEGVRVTNGGSATIRGSTVHNAGLHGVLVLFGANARVEDSVLDSNGQYGLAVNGGTATLLGSSVRNNNFSGIVVVNASALNLGQVDDAGNVCCGNTIENNRLDGLTVARVSTTRLYGNTIRSNGVATGRYGILSVEQSSVVLEGGNVVSANGGGGAFVRGSGLRTGPGDQPVIPPTNEISGNGTGIVAQTANLELQGGVAITDNRFDGINADQGTRVRSNGSTIARNGVNGITALKGSGVSFFGATTRVSENTQAGLACDPTSHFSGNTSGIVNNPTGDVNCLPF
jgi:parallel beta-helix repeat protein